MTSPMYRVVELYSDGSYRIISPWLKGLYACRRYGLEPPRIIQIGYPEIEDSILDDTDDE